MKFDEIDLGGTTLMKANASAVEDASEVRWDLSILYAGIDDPRLDADLRELAEMVKRFSGAYKGRLAERLGPAMRDYAEIEMLQGKIATYLGLRESTDLMNAAVKAKHAEVQRELSALMGEHLTFFELELVELGDEVSRAGMGATRMWPSIGRGLSTYGFSSRIS